MSGNSSVLIIEAENVVIDGIIRIISRIHNGDQIIKFEGGARTFPEDATIDFSRRYFIDEEPLERMMREPEHDLPKVEYIDPIQEKKSPYKEPDTKYHKMGEDSE